MAFDPKLKMESLVRNPGAVSQMLDFASKQKTAPVQPAPVSAAKDEFVMADASTSSIRAVAPGADAPPPPSFSLSKIRSSFYKVKV